jgi:hypothetical protein
MSTAVPITEPDVPRVLLFGHRGAGKSALIGALLKAGETQGETLRGEVVHSSVDLPRIRDAVYNGGKLDPHQTELVSYTIRLKPLQIGTRAVGEPITVTLDDCDGKAAEALLAHPEPITQRAPESPVAKAVVGSDAIVLLVDAASTDDELDEAFEEFDTFLTVVHRAKTDAREVGGFPVFLVLTQCDRLARPGDTRKTWEARVAARIEHAWVKFQTHLRDADEPDDEAPSPFLPFGSVDLQVVAAAVRTPALPDAPGHRDVPYQVAELFRDCFAAARSHHERVRASNARLKWTVRLAISAVTVLLVGLGIFALFPPHQRAPDLAEQVRTYLAQEPVAAIRLSDAEIERNHRILTRFQTDDAFPDLDPDLRTFVTGRIKEIDDYRAYRVKLGATAAPATARSVPELTAIRTALQTELALPPEYSWGETAAAELRAKYLADCTAIEAAERATVEKYREHDRAGTALMLTRAFDAGWLRDIDERVALASGPPFPLDTPLPGSVAVNQPGGEVVTYRVPYEFDEVYHARRYWEQTRDRLNHLRDLADALGATTAPNRPPAVLVIPDPDTGMVVSPAERWAALIRSYPRQPVGYPEWEVRNFPDPARTDLAARLKKSFDFGVQHVQRLMKVRDTREGWQELAPRLAEPAFRDWGRLLHLLARLQDPSAPDPVEELATFLAGLDTKTFDLDLAGFDLVVPLDFTLGLDRVVPAGPLVVTLAHGQEPPVSVKFTVRPGETRDKSTVYRLTREGTAKLPYRAGDELRAELPVKAGTQTRTLVWEGGSSNTFRFDALTHEPRITRASAGTDPAPGVRLIPTPGSTLPKLPVLMRVK